MGELTKTERTRMELWTARDMDFVITPGIGPKGVGRILRHTPCVKPVYTLKIKDYLRWMETKNPEKAAGDKAVCIKLEGMLRYVWRSDVFTKEEHDAAKDRDRDSLRILGAKSRRSVDESS
jgi:hypothetical protein